MYILIDFKLNISFYFINSSSEERSSSAEPQYNQNQQSFKNMYLQPMPILKINQRKHEHEDPVNLNREFNSSRDIQIINLDMEITEEPSKFKKGRRPSLAGIDSRR